MINLLKRLVYGKPSGFDAQLALCDSPMEKRFLRAAWPVLSHRWRVVTQYPLAGYQIDVALPDLRIAIEVDGRDYHTKPQQVDDDKRRDRHLMLRGWLTIRYPGSEIYADADGCAREVEQIILARSGGR